MNIHKNARLTPYRREELVAQIRGRAGYVAADGVLRSLSPKDQLQSRAQPKESAHRSIDNRGLASRHMAGCNTHHQSVQGRGSA